MIIGITGVTGSGKTTLLEVAREAGMLVLDCDAIYHRLLDRDRELLCAIEARFPGSVEQGRLRRKALGAVVFSDPEALADLNRITHQAITAEVLRLLESRRQPHAAIDAIALFESGMDRLCDVTVAVTAPEEAREQRLMSREGISREYAAQRIAAQPDDREFCEKCGYILKNNGTLPEFRGKCLAFLKELGIM